MDFFRRKVNLWHALCLYLGMKTDSLQFNAPRFVLDPRSTQEMQARLKTDPEGATAQAAKQFEGLMLQMMLKSMREASPQEGLFNSDQTRFFTSILDQQLAQDLSTKGFLGFAKQIEEQMRRNMPPGMDALSAMGGAEENTATDSADFPSLHNLPLDLMQQTLLKRQAANLAGSEGAARNFGTQTNRAAASVSADALNRAYAPAQADGTSSPSANFVSRVWPHAVEAANSIGVPPQFLVAHAALESGWGKSEIRLADGSPSYNLFGIKAGKSWSGASVDVQTTEYVDGQAQSTREKFRAYGSYAESFKDYADLLRNNARFSNVLGQQEGGEFARSLQKSGYASDPLYADKLDRIINGATLKQALIG